MTVKELIKELQEVKNQDRIVIMQKDGEGNGYSPLYDTSTDAYVADSTWSGEVYIEELTEELRKQGFTEADMSDDGKPALILGPVN